MPTGGVSAATLTPLPGQPGPAAAHLISRGQVRSRQRCGACPGTKAVSNCIQNTLENRSAALKIALTPVYNPACFNGGVGANRQASAMAYPCPRSQPSGTECTSACFAKLRAEPGFCNAVHGSEAKIRPGTYAQATTWKGHSQIKP